MKDDRLEKEFEEYFKGVNIPNDITADAKAEIKPKRKTLPKFVKFASIAASIVLVLAITLTLTFTGSINKFAPGDSSANSGNYQDENSSGSGGSGDYEGDSDASAEPTPPSSSDPSGDNSEGNSGSSGGTTEPSAPNAPSEDASGGASAKYKFYTDSDLVQSDANAYSLSSLNQSLKLIENFAIADNASVLTCKTGYKDGKLTLVKAEVNILSGLNRDETTIYIEFTDNRTVYSELADYYDGNIYTYRGAQYYLTSTTGKNGEPEFKLHILYNGVKYYFNVHSSDKRAYEKYLQMVTGK